MNCLNINLVDFYVNYKKWVCQNPQTASEMESTIKWISYFIAGKLNKSVILTELVYSASNLLVLFNDIIIHSAKQKLISYREKVKIWLSVLEYSEVFIEISSANIWGETGRWIVIVCVQLLKCLAKLTVLLHYKEKIITCPAIPPHKRNQEKFDKNMKSNDELHRISNIAFSLKRSGRIVRKVNSAPPLHNRLWKPPSFASTCQKFEENPDETVFKQHLVGEMLYIMKPLITLGAIIKYGRFTWKPWLISAATDLTSLYLLHLTPKNANVNLHSFTSAQKVEISRRRLALLLYLMRSPFYEKHTKDRINSFLSGMARNIPLTKIICKPIQQYLPHWQETYFYLWSS